MDFSRPQLLALAKERGFTRYSKLNKLELVRLLETGSRPTIPPKRWYSIIASGVGVPIDKLFTPMDHMHKYDIETKQVSRGYFIRGVNLDGMFNSVWIPEKVSQQEYFDCQTDEEEEEDEVPRFVTVTRPGGWLVPFKDYLDFKNFIKR